MQHKTNVGTVAIVFTVQDYMRRICLTAFCKSNVESLMTDEIFIK